MCMYMYKLIYICVDEGIDETYGVSVVFHEDQDEVHSTCVCNLLDSNA